MNGLLCSGSGVLSTYVLAYLLQTLLIMNIPPEHLDNRLDLA
jgi:hypothetical protein